MKLLRIRSTKHGKIRFTSHRDVARIWERSLRQCRVPMVYSEGFSPRPRISFGLALPTGSESDAEYIDILVDEERPAPCTVEELPEVLTEALPIGLAVTGIVALDRGTPSLQQAVTSCVWDITVKQPIDDVNEWSERMLNSSSIVVTRERKGKSVTDDLRPSIRTIGVHPADIDGAGATVRAEVVTQPRSLRPGELIAALEPHLDEVRIRRREQWIEMDGARLEPLQVDAAATPYSSGGT